MDRLRRQRRPVRAALTRCINEVDAELEKDAPDHDVLVVYFKQLERIVNDLENLDDEIAVALAETDCEDEVLNEERYTVDEYRNNAERCRLKINKVIEPAVRPPSPASSYTTAGNGSDRRRRSFKLPKIELPKFSGKLKDWLGWWSQFEKIHVEEDLHQSDKFQYLIQAIEDKTEAKEIVGSFPPTSENYELAIDALKKRYGREDLQLQVYLRELLGLVITNAGKKEKVKVEKLYLKLETALRALNTLNLSRAEPSMYFYPLVESSLPEDILRAWQRSPMSSEAQQEGKLEMLMKFLTTEVQNEQQIELAKSGFSNEQSENKKKKVNVDKRNKDEATAAGLAAGSKHGCIFCDMTNHPSQICFKGREMTHEQKNQKIKEKKACFRCLKLGHTAKGCKSFVKCLNCGKPHETIMCFGDDKKTFQNEEVKQEQPSFSITRHTNLTQEKIILLKVVVVKVAGPKGSKTVRMLIDEGSQVSYIGSRTVKLTGCKSIGVEYVKNMLLGGYVTDLHEEKLIEVEVSNTKGTLSKKWTLREKEIVCTGIPRIPVGKRMESLKEKKIHFSDLETVHVDEDDIEVLIGSDLRGEVMSGSRYDLGENLVAEETIFGWTLGGPVPCIKKGSVNMNITLFQHSESSLQDLWTLDALGIRDPIQVKTQLQEEEGAKVHFLQNVKRNEDGHNCVGLPSVCEKPYLPTNKNVAEKRLQSTTRKLKYKGAVEIYNGISQKWEDKGIVESVHEDFEENGCHYLPHHPVFRPDSKTTPVRPTFEASCKSSGTVLELHLLTNLRHISRHLNPVDLSPRGFSPKQLLKSKWWEGEDWLKLPEEEWPSVKREVDKEKVQQNLNRKKKAVRQVTRKEIWFRRKFVYFRRREKSPLPKVGDIVLIGQENSQRFKWPIGKIIRLYPGRDGQTRVAEVQTAHDYELKKGKSGKFKVTKVKKGRVLTRPLQRLYLLDISSPEELKIPKKIVERAKAEENRIQVPEMEVKTRVGRQIKKPS